MSEATTPEGTAQETRNGAGGRAAKAREELAAVPSQDLPGDVAVADDLDAAGDLDGDLDGAVDLDDFDDLDDDDRRGRLRVSVGFRVLWQVGFRYVGVG